MIIKNLQKNRGFVILFAVTISAILLSIALGVSNIAFNEAKFSTSAKNTNDAFFAADTGAEDALLKERNGEFIPLPTLPNGADTTNFYSIPGLGENGLGCAFVNWYKTIEPDALGNPYIKTTIISKGYNVGGDPNCASSETNRVERELRVTL